MLAERERTKLGVMPSMSLTVRVNAPVFVPPRLVKLPDVQPLKVTSSARAACETSATKQSAQATRSSFYRDSRNTSVP
jgi:hypothetical protein